MSTQAKENSPQPNDNQFIKGRNWGEMAITDKELVFKGDDKQWFNLPISSLANVVQTSNKNEIGLEFNMEDENQTDFLLCEMHFFIPEEKQEHKEKKEISNENEEEEGNEEGQEEEEEKITYAETIKKQLTKIVNIGNVSNSIARLSEVQMITPRGKFDLYFMENFIKIHGASHNYKIIYKNISRVFLVPKLDGHNHFFVVSLKQPLNQGNTSYPYLIFQIKDEQNANIDLQIPEKMGKIDIPNPLIGAMKDVLAQLFAHIIGIGIIIPSKNFSFGKGSCIKCFNKASEGALYPLEKCILFLHKPVICINHEDIKQVSLQRVDETTMTQRFFDLKIETTKNGDIPFNGFEKAELDGIINYFNTKKIKLIQIDESNNPLESNPGVTSRRQRPVINEMPMELPSEESLIGDDDYSDDEEDENEDEGDEEMEDDEEESSHKKDKKKK